MEILERGEPLAWPREFTCPHCESRLALDVDDIKRNADYFTSYFIDCPVCLEQPDVPLDWWPTVTRLKRNPPQPEEPHAR